MQSNRLGLTAIEVVVSTLLASLLMVAMLGVLRGLKVQAAALDSRLPTAAWQRTLDQTLNSDLTNSRTYQLTSDRLILQGFAGRDASSGLPNWKPTTIVYQIASDGGRSWLTRRVLSGNQHDLVLADVSAIRIGMTASTQSTPEALPIVDGLLVEFWGTTQGGPVHGFQLRKP